MTIPESDLQTAANALKRAIADYNAAYPNKPSFGAATQRYEKRARKFNKLAQEDIERTGQVSSLITETRQHQRNNGFWTRELDAIIQSHKSGGLQ